MARNETASVTLKILAQDLASGKVGAFTGRLDALAKQGGIAGRMMQGFGMSLGMMLNPVVLAARGVTGLTNTLGDAVRAAAEEEAAIAQLTTALEENDPAWDGDIQAVEELITKRQDLAYADAQQRESLQLLVGATKDVTAAEELLGTAMDFARFRNIDLKTSADLLGRAYAGNFGTLSRYGVVLEKGATATEALAQIQKMAKGQAKAYAETTDGKLKRSQIAMGDAMEDLGRTMTPIVAGFATLAAEGIPNVIKAFDNLRRFLDPANAALEDQNDLIREMAAEYGLNVAAVLKYATAQRDANDAMQEAKVDTALLEADIGEYRDSLAGWGYTQEEVNERVAEYRDILTDTTKAQQEAIDPLDQHREAASKFVDEFKALPEFTRKAYEGMAVAAKTSGVGAAIENPITSAVQSVKTQVAEMPPSMRDAIQDGKRDVRQAMQDLKWAMQNPFRGEKYTKFLEKKQRNANRLLIKAIEEGDTAAANAAAALVDGIQAELDRLDDQTYSVNVFVDPSTGRRRASTTGGRAAGGPVSAGGTYLVGERGPELLHMGGGSGHVTPNNALGSTFVYSPMYSTASPEEARRFAESIGPELARAGF